MALDPESSTPQPQVIIPETTPVTADFNSYLTDIQEGRIVSPAELTARATSPEGRVKDSRGRFLVRTNDGVEFRSSPSFYAPITETRKLTDPQLETAQDILQRKKRQDTATKNLADTDSFLTSILNGQIADRKVLAARTNVTDDRDRVRDERGYFLTQTPDGLKFRYSPGYSVPPVTERRRVNPEQRRLLDNVLEAKLSFEITNNGAQDTASFLRDVSLNRIPDKEILEARINVTDDRDRVRNRQDYILVQTPDGPAFRSSVGYSTPAITERRRVNPEQREVITFIADSYRVRDAKAKDARTAELAREVVARDLSLDQVSKRAKGLDLTQETTSELLAFANLEGQVSDSAVEAAVATLLQTGDDKGVRDALSEARASRADVSANSTINTDLDTTEMYIQAARRLNLRSTFWRAVRGTNSATSSPSEVLASYGILDEADRQIIAELRVDALTFGRDKAIVTAFEETAKTDRDFDVITAALKAAAEQTAALGNEGDEIIAKAANTAYDLEIGQFFRSLTRDLSVERSSAAEARKALEAAPSLVQASQALTTSLNMRLLKKNL